MSAIGRGRSPSSHLPVVYHGCEMPCQGEHNRGLAERQPNKGANMLAVVIAGRVRESQNPGG